MARLPLVGTSLRYSLRTALMGSPLSKQTMVSQAWMCMHCNIFGNQRIDQLFVALTITHAYTHALSQRRLSYLRLI